LQAEVNIGIVGHVDHGKTTLTQALSGVWTDTHTEELKRGITIKLGYADITFRKCSKCEGAKAYTTEYICPNCGSKTEKLRRVSFVDAPGHETLMATMLSGSALMNGAILVIAANELCPQPQTKEHLMALEITGVRNIVVVQNKIDLVTKEQALENYRQIKDFLKGTIAENAPIIPISAQRKINVDLLIKAIEEAIKTPPRDEAKPARMLIARSFDINKPGTSVDKIKGGVAGGSIMQGVLKVGDEVEIKPGIKVIENSKETWKETKTIVNELVAWNEKISEAKPGGLIAVGTLLDPATAKADGLAGRLLGIAGTLPKEIQKLSLEVHLLNRVVGTKEELEVQEIKTNEALVLNILTTTTLGLVTSAHNGMVEMSLKLPVCAEQGTRAAISRRVGGRWRLIGYGTIK